MPVFADVLIAAVPVLGLVGLATRPGRRGLNILQQKLAHLLDRFEDPVEALDLSYQKQMQSLQSVRRGVAEVVTAEKRLELQAGQLRRSQQVLQAQARAAVQQGRDDLARLALTRAQTAESELQSLAQQTEQLHNQEAKLQLTAQRLQARVESFRGQRETLKAQYSAAKASARIGEAVTGISRDLGDLNLMVERASERTKDMQARAAAIDQLMASGALEEPGDDIDRQLQATSTDRMVDLQLQTLRQQLPTGAGDQQRLGTSSRATSEEHRD